MPNVPSSEVVNDNLAAGLDRNDGTGGRGGTPSLAAQIEVHTAGGVTDIENIPFEELDDSPTIVRGEQATITHHFRGSQSEAMNRLGIYGRGALQRDSYGYFYRVLETSFQRQKPGRALLSVVSESMSYDVPIDEFSLIPVKLNLDLLKHPRYFYSLMPSNQIPNFSGTSDTSAQIATKQAIIRAVQAYRENPFIPTTEALNNMVGGLHDSIMGSLVSGKMIYTVHNPNFNPAKPATKPDKIGTLHSGNPYPAAWATDGDPNPQVYYVSYNPATDPLGRVAMAMAAANELIGKLWRMEDAPPLNGLEMTLTEYSFVQPYLNLGGYVEDPINDGGLPDYFYSTTWPPTAGNTIFDKLSIYNPQAYGITGQYNSGTRISWLRDADTRELVHGTLWRNTKKWLGAPLGVWDADLNGGQFSNYQRPTIPTHYRQLVLA